LHPRLLAGGTEKIGTSPDVAPATYRALTTDTHPGRSHDRNAIPASVLSACPAHAQDAEQLGPATYAKGGKLIDIALNPNSDAAGNFANTAAYTCIAPCVRPTCA